MKRLLAFVLVLTMLLSGAVTSVAEDSVPAEGVAVYVANENDILWKDDYDKVLTNYGTLTDAQRYSWSGFAWLGDEVNSRIDIANYGKAYEDVTISASDLTSADGKVIDKSNVTVTYLHAVEFVELSNLMGHGNNGRYIFDVVTHKSVTDMEANTLYSAWVAIKPPVDAEGGVYTTTITLATEDEVLASFNYTVNVYGFAQPEMDSLVDLWFFPFATQRMNSGMTLEEYWDKEEGENIPWERIFNETLKDEYLPAIHSELELYAKAGGDVIFAQVEAGNSNEIDPRVSLVKWTRKADGTMEFDYTQFDKWVELNFEHGIDSMIKCNHMAVWKNYINFYDEATDTYVEVIDSPGGSNWKKYWGAFIEDFIVHLDEKSWFDITYMALDEPDYNITKCSLDLLNQYKNKDGKRLKLAVAAAGYHIEELYDEIDDLTFAYGLMGQHCMDIIEQRSKIEGFTTSIYPCGPQANSLWNTPGQSAASAHNCYAIGADGFLRWAFNMYGDDPLASCETGRSWNICAGDMYMIYPDFADGTMQAQTTPRFDKLCEGLRDTAKIEYLKEKLPSLANQIHNDAIRCKGSAKFRGVIDKYSAILASGEIPTLSFDKNRYTVKAGDSVSVRFDESGLQVLENLADTTFLDDSALTFNGSWYYEGQYFEQFFAGSNHYTDSASVFYELTFEGNGVELVGTQSTSYKNGFVYIDGVLKGKTVQADGSRGGFTTIFKADGLSDGVHTLKVEYSEWGRKHLDMAIVRKDADVIYASSDEDVFTVDDSGRIVGVAPGVATLYVKGGDVINSVPVTVTAAEEHAHTMGEWYITVAPTCTEDGVAQRSCPTCGYNESKTAEATGHDWDDANSEPATCVSGGKLLLQCKNDPAHVISAILDTDPDAHVFAEDFTVDAEPTHETDGSMSRHCTLCDAKTDVTVIPATGYGDGNGDGVVNIIDMTISARYIAQKGAEGVFDLSDCKLSLMDMDQNGVVDQFDLNAIAEKVRNQ